MKELNQMDPEELGEAVQRIAKASFIMGWVMRSKKDSAQFGDEREMAEEAWIRAEIEILKRIQL